MRSDDIAISVRNLTKRYRLFGHPGDRVKQFLSFGLKQYHREFTALEEVSFDIKRGETVGVIGRNGAGKSTLLQLVCGILKPTSGTIRVNGRVAALLELGAGFNPEFTGRENVYFQGALMGFTKAQMDGQFDAIAAFADIGDFIDQPVRVYSSGMFVRLAFAVAAHMHPDILVVDEALAVGDSRFQAKCAAWLNGQRNKGMTVFLVSHDMNMVATICDKAMVFDAGRIAASGPPAEAIAVYHQILFGKPGAGLAQSGPSGQIRYGSGEARLTDWGLLDDQLRRCDAIASGARFRLFMRIEFMADADDVSYGFSIKNRRGTILWGLTSIGQGLPVQRNRRGQAHEISVAGQMWLAPGDYFVTLGAAHWDSGEKIDFVENAIEFHVTGSPGLIVESIVNLHTDFCIGPPQQAAGPTGQ